MNAYVISLFDARADLETVGGKGMSLAKLARAGLPVPDGFHITTEAYRHFVDSNGLQTKILSALKDLDASNPSTLEAVSVSISGLFNQASIPEDLAREITNAYNGKPVAVRSSATAEDLPDASFAGQQETFLNVRGAESVLDAVKKCWASLWTARAISYRARQNIAPDSVALAAVVQELVNAEAAGIMFTANPINGKRDEIVINAAWGLGEAVVAGAVTPDSITVAPRRGGKKVERKTARKLVMTVQTESGTREDEVPNPLKEKEVLTDAQAIQLARYGEMIQALYGMPMDIEWALTDKQFSILQARPITSLPPEWKRPRPKAVYARGSFAEFTPDAVSPLFASLGLPIAQKATVKMMNDLLEKDIPDVYQFEVINGYVFVGIPMTREVMIPFIGATIKLSKTLLKTAKERWLVARDNLRTTAAKWNARELSSLSAAQLIEGAREVFGRTADYYTVAQSGTIPNASSSEITFCKVYDSLIKRKGDPEGATLLFGLENQPLRAEKSLYDLAMWARKVGIADSIMRTPTEEIVEALKSSDEKWAEFRTRFDAYLAEFGHAIYDLDFSRALPFEEPAPLIEAMKAYLAGTGGNPYERQREADARRESTAAEMAKRLGSLRRKWFTKLLKWATDTAPLREDSIADLGLGHPQIRRLLGELGRRLVEARAIESVADVYWLYANEAEGLAARLDKGETAENYYDVVASRKTEWKEFRKYAPPATLPEKAWFSVFLPHNDPTGDTLKGIGASAGRVAAQACILFGPEDFHKMKRGDVLVAVTTTPAWTPLFTLASAVVTDIGGPLSHSSIVAREYGIPAVLATGNATRRITDGQTITVDGGKGMVELK